MSSGFNYLEEMKARSIRYEYLDRSETQCQPCDEFRYEDSSYGRSRHQCPLCEGWRTFCTNCLVDHHEGGWNTCKHNESGTCGRKHPACLAKSAGK